MNTKNTSNTIKRAVTIVGFMLGAFAISVFAQAIPGWTPAPANPPNNNVDAPINVGLNTQNKLGSLNLNTSTAPAPNGPNAVGLSVFGKSIFNGQVQILAGSPSAGKVLISDASGNATWGTPSVTPTGSCRSLDSTVSIALPNTNWHQMPVPSECINGMCSIIMKVYDATANPLIANIVTLKVANLIQVQEGYTGADNYWVKPGTSNDGTSCTLGRNGTTAGCDEIINWSDQLVIYDDNASGESSDSSKWTYKDLASDDKSASLSVCR